ncbi:MAG: hypothetical protein KDA68_17025, partial [Planctomycetaceae bacterium]|nr:hypothetical protein [Planctomycetaceae bacterium]
MKPKFADDPRRIAESGQNVLLCLNGIGNPQQLPLIRGLQMIPHLVHQILTERSRLIIARRRQQGVERWPGHVPIREMNK